MVDCPNQLGTCCADLNMKQTLLSLTHEFTSHDRDLNTMLEQEEMAVHNQISCHTGDGGQTTSHAITTSMYLLTLIINHCSHHVGILIVALLRALMFYTLLCSQ